MVAIRVTDLSKSFSDQDVLKKVSLEIGEGEVVALLGHNGSGKSTLLRTMTRLVEPDQGQIELFGENITELSRRKLRSIRSKIGYVFQYHNLVKRASVLSNIIHGALARRSNPLLWFHTTAPVDERARAMEILSHVGLGQFSLKRVDQLSGGQSQRIALARALMQSPSIILADEPVASLDPQAGEDVMNLLVSLARQEGLTLVFSTHHLDHAVNFADRIVGLRGGVVEVDQPASEVNQESLRGMYE